MYIHPIALLLALNQPCEGANCWAVFDDAGEGRFLNSKTVVTNSRSQITVVTCFGCEMNVRYPVHVLSFGILILDILDTLSQIRYQKHRLPVARRVGMFVGCVRYHLHVPLAPSSKVMWTTSSTRSVVATEQVGAWQRRAQQHPRA